MSSSNLETFTHQFSPTTYNDPTERLVHSGGMFAGRMMASQILRTLKAEDEAAKEAYRSTHDQLTGLYNRRGLEEEGARRMKLSSNLIVLMFDIDNFKFVNNNFGHLAGDQLLIMAARIIKQTVRSDDIVGRFGGDEIVVAADTAPRNPSDFHLSPMQRGGSIISRVQTNLGQEVEAAGWGGGNVGISGGMAVYSPAWHSDFASLVRDADSHQYIEKNAHHLND